METIESPPDGLADQTIQNVVFPTLPTTSLITADNRGGTGNRSFFETATKVTRTVLQNAASR